MIQALPKPTPYRVEYQSTLCFCRALHDLGFASMNLFRTIRGAWLSQRRRTIHPQPSSGPLPGPYQPQVEELETRSCPSSLSFKLGTIFVRGPGLNTLSDIKKNLPLAP